MRPPLLGSLSLLDAPPTCRGARRTSLRERLCQAPAVQSEPAPLRWGILGTGGIARSFATDLAGMPGARLVAVGSRTDAAAAAFADAFPGVRPHGSWASLVADDEVDAVYVATPHPWHAENALLAIGAGRHV